MTSHNFVSNSKPGGFAGRPFVCYDIVVRRFLFLTLLITAAPVAQACSDDGGFTPTTSSSDADGDSDTDSDSDSDADSDSDTDSDGDADSVGESDTGNQTDSDSETIPP